MYLSEKTVKKFQAIYKKTFDIDLTYDEAYDLAIRTVDLLKLTYDYAVRLEKNTGRATQFNKNNFK